MLKATLKNLFAHKLRLVLTALSVVLGVGFMTSTLVLRDTINNTFDTVFSQIYAGTDVTVRSAATFGDEGAGDIPLDQSLAATVAAVPGVAVASPYVQGFAQMVDKDGKAIGGQGPPTRGQSWTSDPDLSSVKLVSGRAPVAAGEVTVDRASANKAHFAVGDRIKVVVTTAAEDVTVVGITSFGSTDNLAGSTLVTFDLASAQKAFGLEGKLSSVDVKAKPGVDKNAVRADIAKVLPKGVEAVTGAEAGAQSANDIKSNLSFFSTFLLSFAIISLFVGSFIIVNTFSILVAQRTRELALLRALGASRAQVRRSVLLEALAVGLFASLLGMVVGVGLAYGLLALFSALGIDLPSVGIVFRPTVAVTAIVVGVAVTCAAAFFPARKAAKVPPVAAMRDAAPTSTESLGRRIVGGGVTTAVGAGLLALGLFGPGGIGLVGLGALVLFIGVTLLVPLVARPLALGLGAPLAATGPSGALGRANAMRNPRRTASTASALLVGLALVGAAGTLGASVSKSVGKVVDSSLSADFIVQGTGRGGGGGISPDVAKQLRTAPGIAAVSGLRFGAFRIGTATKALTAFDGSVLSQLAPLTFTAGSISTLATGGLLVDADTAKADHLAVGQVLQVETPAKGVLPLTIGGIYKANQLAGSYLIDTSTFARGWTQDLDQVVLVKAKDGRTAQAADSLAAVSKTYPNVKATDQTEFKQQQKDMVNRLLSLVYGLLVLSVLIAVFGIVNTLALSVVERTREIGLLRAVGMQRTQVKRMIRTEAVVVAVIGGVLGLALGVALAAALVSALSSAGITELAFPVRTLVAGLVFAGGAGVVAAIFPARRAVKLDVLQAITST